MPPSQQTARTTWVNPPRTGATAAPPQVNPSPPTTALGRPGMRQRPSAGTSCGTTWRRSSAGGEQPQSDGWHRGSVPILAAQLLLQLLSLLPFPSPFLSSGRWRIQKASEKMRPHHPHASSLHPPRTAPPRIHRGSLSSNGVLFPNSSIAERIWSRRRRRGLGSCAAVRTGRAGSGSPDT